MTKICVPVFGDTLKEARARADKALADGADLFEIRADLLPSQDIDSIAEAFSGILDRAIITLRSREEEGNSDMPAELRKEWIKAAMDLSFAFVDVELEKDAHQISDLKERKNRTIVSRHFFGSWSRGELKETLESCCNSGGIGKVAAMVHDAFETIQILEILDDIDIDNHALMTMGKGAEASRALAERIGSRIVYCALDADAKVAPGQLDLVSQKRVGSADSIVVGLIGHPLGHTLSPIMQSAAMAELNLPGIYLPFDIPDEKSVVQFMRSTAKLGIRGFNVTIPYKEIAFSSVDEMDDDARRAGAVNVVVIEDGLLHGHNTDIFGLSQSLRESGYDPRKKRALIIGAGGASRAAVIALWKMGAEISITNRTPERADELVRSMRVFVNTISIKELEIAEPFSLIVNATPIGMRGFDTARVVPERLISSADAVMDMVYNPPETPLLNAAKESGVLAISGLEMLLHQGAKAFELWCGREAPIDVMRKQLQEAISA